MFDVLVYNESGEVIITESIHGMMAFTWVDMGYGGELGGAEPNSPIFLYGPATGGADQPLDIRHSLESLSGNVATIRMRFQDADGVWSDATLDNASGSTMRLMSVGV